MEKTDIRKGPVVETLAFLIRTCSGHSQGDVNISGPFSSPDLNIFQDQEREEFFCHKSGSESHDGNADFYSLHYQNC